MFIVTQGYNSGAASLIVVQGYGVSGPPPVYGPLRLNAGAVFVGGVQQGVKQYPLPQKRG